MSGTCPDECVIGITSRLALNGRVVTIRIQQTTEGHCTILRLSGELVSSQREALLEEIKGNNNTIALDLEEVTLVDLDIVQLLAGCEATGVELMNCPPYIREWISREKSRANRRDDESIRR